MFVQMIYQPPVRLFQPDAIPNKRQTSYHFVLPLVLFIIFICGVWAFVHKLKIDMEKVKTVLKDGLSLPQILQIGYVLHL